MSAGRAGTYIKGNPRETVKCSRCGRYVRQGERYTLSPDDVATHQGGCLPRATKAER